MPGASAEQAKLVYAALAGLAPLAWDFAPASSEIRAEQTAELAPRWDGKEWLLESDSRLAHGARAALAGAAGDTVSSFVRPLVGAGRAYRAGSIARDFGRGFSRSRPWRQYTPYRRGGRLTISYRRPYRRTYRRYRRYGRYRRSRFSRRFPRMRRRYYRRF